MTDCRNTNARFAFVLVLVLFVLYAGTFIYRTSFYVDGELHFCLFDDAMISMRYARNLAEGYGPVWNPGGEKVEGYTNPLWMGYMAALHLVAVPDSKVSLLVQITGAICLLANLFVVRKIARFLLPGHTAAWLGAVVLTALYLPLNNWAMQGMEVGAATLIVSCAVWLAFRCMAEGKGFWPLYALMAVSVLVRMDLLVPSAFICGFLTLADRPNRHRHWMAGLVALGGGLAVQTGIRFFYYGDLLPNTYYLKMTGYPALLRISRGLLVLVDFIWRMNWIIFALPLLLWFLRRDRYVALPVLVFGGQLAYSVYVGGDAWEWWGGANRYVCVAMPLFFVLLSTAAVTIADRLDGPLPEGGPESDRFVYQRAYVTAGFFVFCLLSVNSLKGPQSLRQLALIDRPIHVASNEKLIRQARFLRKFTRPDAKIALVWAGIVPYFADRRMVDISGKNDRHVARLEMHTSSGPDRFRHFIPGHLKWDYGHSIGRLRPDVVFQAAYPAGEADAFLAADYRRIVVSDCAFYLRNGSPKLHWEQVGK